MFNRVWPWQVHLLRVHVSFERTQTNNLFTRLSLGLRGMADQLLRSGAAGQNQASKIATSQHAQPDAGGNQQTLATVDRPVI